MLTNSIKNIPHFSGFFLLFPNFGQKSAENWNFRFSHGSYPNHQSSSTLKRGASLLTGSQLLDIEKPYEKKIFNPRITATSIATEDGLSLTPRLSDGSAISTSRGSVRSANANFLLTVPDSSGDTSGGQITGGRQSETSNTSGSLSRGFSRSSRASGVSIKSKDSHVSFRETAPSMKSTASSMTELYYSAVRKMVSNYRFLLFCNLTPLNVNCLIQEYSVGFFNLTLTPPLHIWTALTGQARNFFEYF